MSPEQIIAAFAARRQQLDRIVADIAAEKPKSRAQHHLIVGQRGMGKTMLLARIAAELRTDPELSPASSRSSSPKSNTPWTGSRSSG